MIVVYSDLFNTAVHRCSQQSVIVNNLKLLNTVKVDTDEPYVMHCSSFL